MTKSTENFRPSVKQIKAARELVGLTQGQLAKASGVAERTLAGFEAGTTVPHESTIAKIVSALESRGVTFSNGDRPTVSHDPSKAIIPT